MSRLRKVFSEQRDGESLDEFSPRCVAPTTGEMNKLNREVDEFVRFLEQRFSTPPHSVSKVIKAGSLGKGTAVRASADIDLVMYLNNVSDIYTLKRLREPVLDSLQEAIKSYTLWQGRIIFDRRTQFSVQYILDGNEVDILPAFAMDHTNDTRNRDLMYQHMRDVGQKESMGFIASQFSASLSPLQVTFVKHKDESVKKVIRLLKKWKKERKVKNLPSYVLELLTIYAAKQAGREISTDDLFVKVLGMLRDIRSQTGMWFGDNYTIVAAKPGDKFVHTAPYLLDVANGYNDILYRVDKEKVSQSASDLLKQLQG
ncbi:2'-5'-oligoadenylate synthase 1-like [Littorina saxatilis]|uniref:2'-5'-oligoadenylate synthase 1-like n=1 Tax=Littorina saxatilis TaxID=31220 RepID=UPI0038B5F2DA